MINLLIVDDEQATRTILKNFIDFDKFNIRLMAEVENGEEAIDLFRKSEIPHIVITDMNMPVLDGISLMKYLSDEYPQVKIIVASGYFEYQYTKAALQNGAVDYLLKPIDEMELNQVIEQCVEKIKAERSVERIIQNDKGNVQFERKQYQYILEQMGILIECVEQGDEEHYISIINSVMNSIGNENDVVEKQTVLAQLMLDKLNDYCIRNNIDLHFDSNVHKVKNQNIVEVVHSGYRRYFRWKREKEENIEIIETIKNYIDIHYRETLYSSEIAEQFHISKEYMSTLFSSTYNITMGRYINMLKIKNAKKQLLYGNRSVKEIAYGLGFEDDNYFCRVFKKLEGITPSKYRAENKKKNI